MAKYGFYGHTANPRPLASPALVAVTINAKTIGNALGASDEGERLVVRSPTVQHIKGCKPSIGPRVMRSLEITIRPAVFYHKAALNANRNGSMY